MNIAECYIEHNASAIDQLYTYQYTMEKIQPGMRVKVNFARRECVAFVMRIEENTSKTFGYELKPILEVLDEKPVLNQEGIELAQWIAKTTISPMISCLQAILPSKLKPKSNQAAIKYEDWVRAALDHTQTPRQKQAYDHLKTVKEMKRSEWLAMFKSVAKTLEKNGSAEIFQKEATIKEEETQIKSCSFELSQEQKNAVECILHAQKEVICLHGVTGSGKTEVFLHCAQEMLRQGKQVLFLVPEISLTPLMVQRVKERFGNEVAIYHSGLNDQEKYAQYQSVRNHEKNIVVGTRSAVFMPFDHLGLIIVDEEHDTSYKQDSLPRYHARDVAIWRGRRHHACVVLASATPSLETYARAVKGVYQLVTLSQRVTNAMPQVTLVNMQKQIRQKDSYILSQPLIEAMKKTLDEGKQVILLLNRRGYQPIMRCDSCHEVIKCPHCDRALVYHKDSQMLRCHLCGYALPLMKTCPICHQGTLKGMNYGTQMLAEKVQEYFPDKRILRMDADTTARKNAHHELLEKFGNHEADILLGTQMIAKGLDFEDVTLVGILQGDSLLYRSDYRCSEMTFDLLCQASGRSGRGSEFGQVMIQVFDENHYAVSCVKNHDYLSFFKQEMQYRHLAQYPPYTYLCNLVYISKNASAAYQLASQAMNELKQYGFKVLGVSELIKIKDEYRYRICVKSKSLEELQKKIYEYYRQYRQSKTSVNLQIDMNPLLME